MQVAGLAMTEAETVESSTVSIFKSGRTMSTKAHALERSSQRLFVPTRQHLGSSRQVTCICSASRGEAERGESQAPRWLKPFTIATSQPPQTHTSSQKHRVVDPPQLSSHDKNGEGGNGGGAGGGLGGAKHCRNECNHDTQ